MLDGMSQLRGTSTLRDLDEGKALQKVFGESEKWIRENRSTSRNHRTIS
jgi:hypothetical protein